MEHDGKSTGLFSDEEPKKKKKKGKKIKISETQYRRIFNESLEPKETPSFDYIYRNMYDKMYKYVCRKYTNNENQAAEYCQIGFLKVMDKLHKYNGTGSLEGWVSFVIKNTILDELRKNKKMQYSDGEDGYDFSSMEAEEDEVIEKPKFTGGEIKRAVEQLTPAYQVIFNLHFIEGMKHKEIAERLGINIGTSKSNLFKAKKRVREILTNLNEQDESDETSDSGGDSGGSSGGGWTSGASSYTSLTRGKANPISNSSKWESGVGRGVANSWV